MQIGARTVKKHFEKSMEDYDKNAVVQRLIAGKLIDELVKIKTSFSDVLELGSGTGLLTKEFFARCKYALRYPANRDAGDAGFEVGGGAKSIRGRRFRRPSKAPLSRRDRAVRAGICAP